MNTELEDTLAEALRHKADTVPHSPMPRLGAARHARRWLVPVAAAAVAIAGVAGVAVAVQPTAEQPAPPAAAKPKPGTLGPGEVYYVRSESDDSGTLVHHELWQSPQRTGPWQRRVSGAHVVDQGPTSGRCFPAAEVSEERCTHPGSWFNPTVDFLATASTDPAEIARQLHAEAVQEERARIRSGDFVESDETYSEANLAYLELSYLGGTLYANGLPAAVSAALKKVVAGLPGIEVNPKATNLRGRHGTGYALRNVKGEPLTLIFDGDAYIGNAHSWVEHGAAPGLGKPPSRTF